ncbi:MAG TPA: hypothetical protein VG456_09115 [Candidatus Sulfopaludibacter sp.]|jgi:hypothetical protein|nr:hypothetical protein [Candidatus Sulfopaludibacter sp.]
MRLFLSLIFLSVACHSQPITVGVKGAVRVTSDLDGIGISETKRFLYGPMVEVRLPFRFAIEADALYNRFGYTQTYSSSAGGVFTFFTERIVANSWEFPLLLKYRLPLRVVHPYLSFGYAPRHSSGRVDFSSVTLGGPYASSGPKTFPSDHAWIVGGGVRLPLGPFSVSPEIRYLHWNDSLVYFYRGGPGYDSVVPQNEAQVLVGFGWGGK